jgi:hypothetical protein
MSAADQAAGQADTFDTQACLAQQTDKDDRFCLLESVCDDNECTSPFGVFIRQIGNLSLTKITLFFPCIIPVICLCRSADLLSVTGPIGANL